MHSLSALPRNCEVQMSHPLLPDQRWMMTLLDPTCCQDVTPESSVLCTGRTQRLHTICNEQHQSNKYRRLNIL
ncbi:hypothetical protein BsWGS_09115 [Bradybaena similaris]